METVLVLMHVEADGSLAKSALETLGAAKSLGGTFVVGLIGANVQPGANAIAGCGAAKFLGVSGAEFSQARYGTDAAAAEAICRAAKATVVTAPATSRWNRVLAGVAHRLSGRADTHVTGISTSRRRDIGHALVLSSTDGSRVAANATAVVHRVGIRLRRSVERLGRHGDDRKRGRDARRRGETDDRYGGESASGRPADDSA